MSFLGAVVIACGIGVGLYYISASIEAGIRALRPAPAPTIDIIDDGALDAVFKAKLNAVFPELSRVLDQNNIRLLRLVLNRFDHQSARVMGAEETSILKWARQKKADSTDAQRRIVDSLRAECSLIVRNMLPESARDLVSGMTDKEIEAKLRPAIDMVFNFSRNDYPTWVAVETLIPAK